MDNFASDSAPMLVTAVILHQIFKRNEGTRISRLVVLLTVVPTCVFFTFGDRSEGIFPGLCRSLVRFQFMLISSILCYRLSPWHPLAQYPGPLFCKTSKIYWAIVNRNGNQHKLLAALHGRYGDIVRIGPNEVSITNPSAIDPLMGSSGQPKGQFWEGRLPESAPAKNLVGIRNKKEHTRRRRTWLRALSPVALKSYEGFLVTRTQQMTDLLLEKISKPIEISEWMGYYSFDVMGDLVFGEGPEMMKNGDQDALWHLLEESQKTLFFFGLIPWFGKQVLRMAAFIPLLEGVRNYRNYAINRVKKRKLCGSPHKDLFHYLIDEDGISEQKPTTAEILSDSALAIIAGADTTASALTSFIYLIMRHPKVYLRLREEVDSLGSDFMNPDKQTRLAYLNATIHETLRLFPPVQSGSQREVTSGTGAAMIGPYLLTEGTACSIAFSLVHKDPRNFSPEPETFLPERWLSGELRQELEPEIFREGVPHILNQTAYLAFSYGPANCIGKQLAYMEMRMAICSLLHWFYFTFAPGYNPRRYEDDFRDYYIVVRGSLPVVLARRT